MDRRIKQLRVVFFIVVFRILHLFMKTKKYWVICERGTEARDNAYYFYCYLKKQHPNQKVYFFISPNSADYEKVKEDAVIYGSIKSIFYTEFCERIISTHHGLVLPYIHGNIFKLTGYGSKFVFLQHGIILNYLEALTAEKAPMRLFICGAYPEYKYIKSEYGFNNDVVKYTGLARFDNYSNIDGKIKNRILIMPTWRQYIASENQFLKSDYYNKWKKVLGDSNLKNILHKYNYEIIFYPHYEMQKYINLFESNDNSLIIASAIEYDVQDLLISSKVLVTDYSSVFFDFCYMNKPVLYYQFDKEDFMHRHYSKGYFDYDTDGFGPVLYDSSELIFTIEQCLRRECTLEHKYKEKVNRFFTVRDKNNCERIFKEIMEDLK